MRVIESYTIQGQTVARKRFYEVACDPRRHVVVEACAGAGKTWMLVSRMLRALLDGAEPQHILAITFTKKAAGEMRARLLQWLEEFSGATDAKLDEELQMRGIAAAHCPVFRDKLRALNLRLMQATQPVQIRTFHSWFAQLTRSAPVRLRHAMGLPASYELLEDDTQIVDAVWPRFWARVHANEELSAIYRESVAALGRSNTLAALKTALDKRSEIMAADDTVLFERSVSHFTTVFPEFAGLQQPDDWFGLPATRSLLRAAAIALASGTAKTPQRDAAALEQLMSEDRWPEVDGVLLTDKGLAPQRPATAGMTEAQKQILERARTQCECLVKARIQHQAWLHQQRMVTLGRALLDAFADLKRERGWVDMGDIEQVALRMHSDPSMGAWLQEVLDWRVRHLLIDEFQDTNPLQWQVLQGWLHSYAGQPAQAPSVFIVGDPKQSIYRFRRADPQVFQAARQFVVEGLQGEWLACDHTRRNAQSIIALTNAVMQAAADQQQLSGYRAHTTESAQDGELWVLPLVKPASDMATKPSDPAVWRDSLQMPRLQAEEHLRQLEARQAAQWLSARVARGEDPAQILVLARKNAQLVRMEAELRALGLACVRADQDHLFQAPEVQDMAALLQCLLVSSDDLALARALKSPVFGLDDAALIRVALAAQQGSGKGKCSWREALDRLELQDAWGQPVVPALNRWQAWLQRWPVHDALSHIMDDGRMLERYAQSVVKPMFLRVQSNLQALVNASLQLGGGRFVSARRLLRSLRDGRIKMPLATQTGAVRLLTIHKAKGLEADTVLLLDTMPAPENSKSLQVLVQWPAEQAAPRQLAFVTSLGNPAKSLEAVVQAERDLDAREDLHCLYVAMTRARKCLVLSANQGKKSAQALTWYHRLHATGLLREASVGAVAGDTTGIETLRHIERLPWAGPSPGRLAEIDGQERAFDEAECVEQPESDTVTDMLARRGQALHVLLQSLPMHDGEPQPGCAQAQIQNVLRQFQLDAGHGPWLIQSVQAIASKQAWLWDRTQVAWVSNEMDLWCAGRVYRLDRVLRLRSGQGWWIVDFKSTSQPGDREDYRRQIAHYASALRLALGETAVGEPIRTALIGADGERTDL